VGLALATAGGLAGCTGGQRTALFQDEDVPAGSFQLVAFDSCDAALDGLRTAAKAVVGPYGFAYGPMAVDAFGGASRDMAGGPAVPSAAGEKASGGAASNGSAPNYSGTNTHEAGVDEPDLVKTDGRRIVTTSRGVLRVVDAASRSLVGRLDLAEGDQDPVRYVPGDLLLSGDHALVLMRKQLFDRGGIAVPGPAVEDSAGSPISPMPVAGPKLMLIDISGAPRVLGEYTMEGELVDARQVGSVARVVVRSGPRLVFPYVEGRTDQQRLADNKKIIDRATADDWLPRFQVTSGGHTETGHVDCASVSRPATYTGANMLTVLTFDLTASALGRGDGLTIVADGDTVYGSGTNLYVASDQRWRAMTVAKVMGGAPIRPAEARTEIYKFNVDGNERPRFVGGGSVPGYVINQYALSDWDGKLRVATTTGEPWAGEQQRKSESAVYVLAQNKRKLVVVGQVGGLGKGERIYAVRFTGPIGYVVTFRQTDPLYTLDLSDPSRPRVIGELKISGYSAYLHPAGGTRLIGIGQEASSQGRTLGTQVSLFDVADPAHPKRLSQYHLSGGHSTAEFDPHAFLYWPSTGLLVVPLQMYDAGVQKSVPDMGALVLRVDGDRIDEVGFIEHPYVEDPINPNYPAVIQRSLMIDGVLWTASDGGLMATDPASLDRLAWLPY